jgi:hypothetical protein
VIGSVSSPCLLGPGRIAQVAVTDGRDYQGRQGCAPTA